MGALLVTKSISIPMITDYLPNNEERVEGEASLATSSPINENHSHNQDTEVGISSQTRNPTPHQDSGSNPLSSQVNDQVPMIRRSARGRIPRRYFHIEEDVFFCTPSEIEEPTSYEEAITSPNKEEWINAMKEEMDSMSKNKVWELVDLPPK